MKVIHFTRLSGSLVPSAKLLLSHIICTSAYNTATVCVCVCVCVCVRACVWVRACVRVCMHVDVFVLMC